MARKKKWIVMLVAASPCLCCFGGLGFVQYQVSRTASGLQQELDKARSMGVPVTVAELVRATPPAENAAKDYAEAISLIDNSGPLRKPADAVTSALSRSAKPEELAKAKDAFPKLAPALAIIERGADKKRCDFHKNWEEGWNVLFPEYAHMKSFEKLLSYKVQEQSSRGDWKGALKTVERMQSIARHVGEEPILIAMLVQIANEAITHAAFRKLIAANRSNPAFLAEARKVAESFGPLPNFKYAMHGEVVMGRTAIYQLRSFADVNGLAGMGSFRSEDDFLKYILMTKSLKTAFDRKLVQGYNHYFQIMPKDPSDWEGLAKAGAKQEVWIESDRSLLNILNQILFPVFSQAALAIGRTQAQRRLTLTSIDLFAAKASSGSLPAKLAQKTDSMDPFTNKPLIYKPAKNGFILYSVDQDRRDDGGIQPVGSSVKDLVADMR